MGVSDTSLGARSERVEIGIESVVPLTVAVARGRSGRAPLFGLNGDGIRHPKSFCKSTKVDNIPRNFHGRAA